MADTYKAQLDTFALDIETLDDRFEKAIACYDFPYRDGAATEDMGERARTVNVRCYFLGERYTEHRDFVEHIKKQEFFELHHPKYGLLKGRIEAVSVRHDDRELTAEVDLSFVEDLLSREMPASFPDVQAGVEESFSTGQDELIGQIENDVRAALGNEAAGILEKELDPDIGIVEQFSDISLTARRYLQKVEGWNQGLAGWLTEVTNPSTSLLNMVSYPVTLPGLLVSTLAAAVERQALVLAGLRGSPGRFLDSLTRGCQDMKSGIGLLPDQDSESDRFGERVQTATAQRLALEGAFFYSEDEERRQVLRKVEQSQAFDVLGNYLPQEDIEPVMTMPELERSLGLIRTEIQTAVDVSRGVSSLKTMAEQLVCHVNQIKLERDRILKVRLDNPMPLHLVCLGHGLSYRYAPRILAINNIVQPSFTQGEVLLYARSG